MISSIVQFFAFWMNSVWSLSTIKNVFIIVLSGAVLPLWFMLDAILKWIDYTPFSFTYFEPSRIYLGDIPLVDVGDFFIKQALWIIALFLISHVMWLKGKKRIVIQAC